MSQRFSTRSDREKSGNRRGTVVHFPFSRFPQSEAVTGTDDPSPTHSMLIDALRAKDERLKQLVHDRERFIHDLQGCILHSLYGIQTGLNAVKPPAATHVPAEPLRKRVNTLIRSVRDKIFTLERDTATGFELEAELRRLVGVCRHFGDMMVTLSIDPCAASRLTREESRHLLHIAQAVTSDSIRRCKARRLEISLRNVNGRIRFNLKEDDRRLCPEPRAKDDKDEMGLRSIPAQVRRIGGCLAIRSKPRREISIVLDFDPARARRLQQTPPGFPFLARTGRLGTEPLHSNPPPSPLHDFGNQEGVPLT
jgi:signal transduction histidine kinase